jgi:dihydrofolate synthase/folylpolyglutamate synthase
MNFEEAVDWLYGFQKFGIKPGLERISYIADELGNPQKKYKVIHVGGTNGKGSVCKYLESVLVRSGYKVGVYTSPHIQHILERITINKKRITEDEIVSLVEIIKPIVEEMMKNNNIPTFFEVFTAMAFQLFSKKNIDFAIIEVGLGGRFDATNIVKPQVSVITNISLEHQNILGAKIEDIAFEKAGIIKQNIPVVTAVKDNAFEVIDKVAEQKNSVINKIDASNWKRINNDEFGQEFFISGFLNDYTVQTSILGGFQGENIALAIGAVEFLIQSGFDISFDVIVDGIKKTLNPGRAEIVSRNPMILLDGAHNPSGANVLVETIKNDFEYNRLILVIGILSDKNIKEILKTMVPIGNSIVLTKSKNLRACEPIDLKNKIEELGLHKRIVIKDDIVTAVRYAKSVAKKDDLICITGSLFTVGKARDILASN